MGNSRILWAFFFLGLGLLLSPSWGLAQETINQGAGTFVPGSAVNSPAVQQKLNQTTGSVPRVQVPTPDTIPPPSGGSTQTSGVPAPSTTVQQQPSLGQYRNERGEVKLAKMFLDRYKHSVVRVTAKDHGGNILASAMGVGVGRNAQYIATPLSIVLGNEQQWADSIEVTHSVGNKYNAKIALIDEEKNLVLLAPEANPAAIPFVREVDERPQISVYSISFSDGGSDQFEVGIHEGLLAAANSETGLLSVSGRSINDAQAGTGLISAQGELVGMLLPGGRGVLSSAIQKLIIKAQKAEPIDPSRVGAILGRGVLVHPDMKGAFPTITAALEAIKKGEAPKADPKLYTAAKNKTVAPRDSDKVVVKVMPGIYKEANTIFLPSNTSLAGSGPDQTTLIGPDPNKPVLLIQNAENTIVSGFRIVPAALQTMKAPALIVSKSGDVTLRGNLFEAKGGVSLWINEARDVRVQGNTFARGLVRALSCDQSNIEVEGNAFVGDWPMAMALDRKCSGTITRNLFIENKVGLTVSSLAGSLKVERNSFIRIPAAIKITGSAPQFTLNDNLFFECAYGLYVAGGIPSSNVGRNAIWKTKFLSRSRPMVGLDLVRTEPKFVAPAIYDFRIQPGKSQLGMAAKEPGADLGAFQSNGFLGTYTQQMVRSLGAAMGEKDLASMWGL